MYRNWYKWKNRKLIDGLIAVIWEDGKIVLYNTLNHIDYKY